MIALVFANPSTLLLYARNYSPMARSEKVYDSLRDVAFTTPTPFTQDESEVAHDELATNLRFIVEAGASLVVPCGNTGEYYALTDEERIAVVQTHVDAVGDEATVVAGVGGSKKHATRLARQYEEAGADAILVMDPNFTYLHERGLLEYYRAIIEAVDVGVVVYKRGEKVSKRLLTELSTEEQVVGVKYAVNDIKAFSQVRSDAPGDVVWINGIAERYALSFHVEGASGYTTGIGNFVPEATLALHDALIAENYDRALELREALRPLEDIREECGTDNTLRTANNVPVVKYGQELADLYGGPCREPLVELPDDDAARVRDVYENVQQLDL